MLLHQDAFEAGGFYGERPKQERPELITITRQHEWIEWNERIGKLEQRIALRQQLAVGKWIKDRSHFAP